MTYYNEYDPKAAAWLRELIKAGLIPPGEVDTRSITEVRPHELDGFAQQHFFAGIGGWAYALRLAGWPDDRPVRTGSCPCQPFSAAGKGLGEKDERHLWPVFRDLITFGAPTVTFGEQVASKAGRDWLARVRIDLEGLGYAVGAADLCAAGVGAPHIRQRLFWVANPHHDRRTEHVRQSRQGKEKGPLNASECGGVVSRLANSDGERFSRRSESHVGPLESKQPASRRADAVRCSDDGGLGHAESERRSRMVAERKPGQCERARARCAGADGGMGHAACEGRRQAGCDIASNSEAHGGRPGDRPRDAGATFWSAFDLIPCSDGKARRVESGTFPLAHGIPGRVGLLRGYGNAIVPQAAAEFIAAYCEVT